MSNQKSRETGTMLALKNNGSSPSIQVPDQLQSLIVLRVYLRLRLKYETEHHCQIKYLVS